MARRTETLTIPGIRSEAAGERDNGKVFILTEMDAYSGQDWALRALLALAASGVQLPAGATTTGWAGLASFGVTALLQAPYGAIKPLLDEMLAQAKYQHHSTTGKPMPPQPIIHGANCQIEEIKTFLTLHTALFKLHTGFSPADATPT
jgi:hypothetical protein